MRQFRLAKIVLFLGAFFILNAYGQVADKSGQFVILTDIHFDPFLSCSAKPCPLIQKLQAAPIDQWKQILAEEDTTAIAYGKDSNYTLVKSSLAAAQKEAQAAHVQFILVLGDFLAHRYNKNYFTYSNDLSQQSYIAFVKKTLEFLASELQQAFPQTDIYWVVGNNDSDEGDYVSEPQGRFYKNFSEIEARLIKNSDSKKEVLQTSPKGGYYALNAPNQPSLRLIFLNSVLFSTKAKGSGVEQAAEEELNWLHQELAEAKQKDQKVFIAMHIPTGIDVYTTLLIPFSIIEFWKPAYTQRFLAEIQQASAQISGIFTAHVHADTFQIFTDAEHHAIPIIGTPSISPIFGNNPAFKVYTYSALTLRLIDFATYYYSLNANKSWEKEYDFDEVYQLNHSEGEIIKGLYQLQPTGELADHYKNYYAVSNDSQPITKYNKWLPYYWCAIRGLTSNEYQSCLASTKNINSFFLRPSKDLP